MSRLTSPPSASRVQAGTKACHSIGCIDVTSAYQSGPRPIWPQYECGSRTTYIERLNSAVPDNIGTQSGGGAADDDVIVDGDTFGPQHPALIRALVGVVLERDGSGMAVVCRIRTHTAGMPFMALPVGWDYAIALWTSRGARGGLCPITSWRWRAAGGIRLNTRRLHPSTVACWAGGASQVREGGSLELSDKCAEERRAGGSRWWECLGSMVCSLSAR
jgi:hypothetical protein